MAQACGDGVGFNEIGAARHGLRRAGRGQPCAAATPQHADLRCSGLLLSLFAFQSPRPDEAINAPGSGTIDGLAPMLASVDTADWRAGIEGDIGKGGLAPGTRGPVLTSVMRVSTRRVASFHSPHQSSSRTCGQTPSIMYVLALIGCSIGDSRRHWPHCVTLPSFGDVLPIVGTGTSDIFPRCCLRHVRAQAVLRLKLIPVANSVATQLIVANANARSLPATLSQRNSQQAKLQLQSNSRQQPTGRMAER